MCQSVCFHVHQVQFSEIPVSDDGLFEPFFNKVEDSAKSLIETDEDRELDLKSLISIVSFNNILEVWKISRYNYLKFYQHVILLNTEEYLYTCFMLVTYGIICRHFFKVFVESSNAYFHLTLISKCCIRMNILIQAISVLVR
ncbi:14871_t:CDS:1 [Funneliformis caledonium]|uniref:14871_t:CDS:1 n=1 Tax=Funneliformis caledonium TaxID=1117310 RepID=A0A9N9F7U0_9GLOM|nr:14871_t:CDS:1 [Funneliformis caledonium]